MQICYQGAVPTVLLNDSLRQNLVILVKICAPPCQTALLTAALPTWAPPLHPISLSLSHQNCRRPCQRWCRGRLCILPAPFSATDRSSRGHPNLLSATSSPRSSSPHGAINTGQWDVEPPLGHLDAGFIPATLCHCCRPSSCGLCSPAAIERRGKMVGRGKI